MNAQGQGQAECPCPFCQPAPTFAEVLMAVAQHYLAGPERLILVETGNAIQPRHVERVVLAMKFARMPAGFRFRAVYEGWTVDEIFREMH